MPELQSLGLINPISKTTSIQKRAPFPKEVPKNEDERAAYVQQVLSSNVTPKSLASLTMKHYPAVRLHNLPLATDEDLQYTPQNPLIRPSCGSVECRFTTPCLGEMCGGVLIKYYNCHGQCAQELVCPYHEQVYRGRVLSQAYPRLYKESMRYVSGRSKYSDWTVDTYPGPRDKLEGMLRWVRQDPLRQSMIVMGTNGIGKTGALLELAKARMREYGDSVLFLPSGDLLEGLTDFKNEADTQFLHVLRKTDVLVLDDLGTRVSEYIRERLYRIIDFRYTKQKPTLISTNLYFAQVQNVQIGSGDFDGSSFPTGSIEKVLGLRIASRMLDKSEYMRVAWEARDLRQRQL